MPETNPVSRDLYNVAAVLWLQSTVHAMLFPTLKVLYLYLTALRRMCAMLSIAVVCSSLMLCFRGVVLKYILSHYETVPVAPVLLSVSLLVSLSTRAVFLTVSSPYFKNCSASLLITFLSPEIAVSIFCVPKRTNLPTNKLLHITLQFFLNSTIDSHVKFFLIADYNARFIIKCSSLHFQFLIP